MSSKQALLKCRFSWRKTCLLYHDSIEISGKSYNLHDLTYIHPTYRTLFGIPSARLELCFGLHRLTLRGIPDREIVRQMVAHLLPYAKQADPDPLSRRGQSHSNRTREAVRAQAKAWERTSKIPAIPNSSEQVAPIDTATAPEGEEKENETAAVAPLPSFTDSAHAFDDFLDLSEQPTSHIPASLLPISRPPISQKLVASLSLSEQPVSPLPLASSPLPEQPGSQKPATTPPEIEQADFRSPTGSLDDLEEPILPSSSDALPLPEHAPLQGSGDLPPVSEPPHEPMPDQMQCSSVSLASPTEIEIVPTSREPSSRAGARHPSRPLHIPRLQPPLRAIQLVQPEKKMLEACSMPVPAFKSSVLPIIHVPVRLQPGECAHYSIGAALCSDRLAGSERAPYPPLDHGLLILTNQRIFYLGKRSQLILAYTHLWYVSLLYNAIALHIEGQFRRIIMEVEHPEEWASRIEQLAFIARRAKAHSAQPATTFVLPGLKPSSVLPVTLKRPVLPVPEDREVPPTSTAANAVRHENHVARQIVKASTVEFYRPAPVRIVEATTIECKNDVDPSIVEAATTELISVITPSTPQAHPDMSEEIAVPQIENEPTREIAPQTEHQRGQSSSPTSQALPDYPETSTPGLSNSVEEATRLLSSHEKNEQASAGIEEVVEAQTSVLHAPVQGSPQSGDEQTMPLRRRKIAEIITLPLRPRGYQHPADTDMKIRRVSRTLSRHRLLKNDS